MTMMRPELALTATRTWIGFGLMCLGMFMAILDIQVVATSLPTIQNALAISPEAMSWIQMQRRLLESWRCSHRQSDLVGGWITQVRRDGASNQPWNDVNQKQPVPGIRLQHTRSMPR
jgi:hypothetical protein